MSKTVKIMIALVLALAVAAPALADMKLNGYYRLQMNSENFNKDDQNSSSFIDNRLRMRLAYDINDSIQMVYYCEVDTPWGEASKGGVGGGGKVGADGVNVETKNAYVAFKIPSTGFTLTTGIQGIGTGNPFESLVYDDDMAGALLKGAAGPVDLAIVYSKWDEGLDAPAPPVDDSESKRSIWNDTDLYAVTATIKAGENAKVYAHATYMDLNAKEGATDLYLGVGADVRFGKMGVDGFFLYRSLDGDDVTPDGDAFVVDGKFRTVLPMGDLKVHLAYFSENDDDEDANVFTKSSGGFEYHNDNLMIFLTDVYYNNGSQGALALHNAAYAGYGLIMATVSGKLSLPQGLYVNYGAGYFTAVDDEPEGAAAKDDTDLGFEVAAMIGKKFAEKYDVSLRGAYASLGDFYGDADEDLWKVVGMVNVGF